MTTIQDSGVLVGAVEHFNQSLFMMSMCHLFNMSKNRGDILGFCIPILGLDAWNPKQPFINGCFNWMIPNLYIGNGCFTKHPFFDGCLGFQVYLPVLQEFHGFYAVIFHKVREMFASFNDRILFRGGGDFPNLP